MEPRESKRPYQADEDAVDDLVRGLVDPADDIEDQQERWQGRQQQGVAVDEKGQDKAEGGRGCRQCSRPLGPSVGARDGFASQQKAQEYEATGQGEAAVAQDAVDVRD